MTSGRFALRKLRPTTDLTSVARAGGLIARDSLASEALGQIAEQQPACDGKNERVDEERLKVELRNAQPFIEDDDESQGNREGQYGMQHTGPNDH